MSQLPHGYTNRTRRREDEIEKRYEGAEPFARAEREFTCLTHLIGMYPVPEVIEFDASGPALVMTVVAGRHGQELLPEGTHRKRYDSSDGSSPSFKRLVPRPFQTSEARGM